MSFAPSSPLYKVNTSASKMTPMSNNFIDESALKNAGDVSTAKDEKKIIKFRYPFNPYCTKCNDKNKVFISNENKKFVPISRVDNGANFLVNSRHLQEWTALNS